MNRTYEILCCLPLLSPKGRGGHMAEDTDIAADVGCTTQDVMTAIAKLQKEGYSIDSWPSGDGWRYAVNSRSWSRVQQTGTTYWDKRQAAASFKE